MTNAEYPTARRDDLVVQETDDELLVYDLRSNKASCLNPTAALVWNKCDGTKPVSVIAKELSAESRTEFSVDVVSLAISQFSREHLLEREYPGEDRLSRRNLIKKIGLSTAVALPLVVSMVAPSAAHANSACIAGGSCTCNAPSNMMVGEICIPAVACTDTNCRCSWADAGNTMGICVP